MTAGILSLPVRKSIVVNAPVHDAFEVFTDEIDSWWPRTHHIGKTPMVRIAVEGHPGGRCYSRHVDGTECDWGQVLAWEPPRRLVIAWKITPDWGSQTDVAKASEVEVNFVALQGSATRVDLEHRFFERQGLGAEVLRSKVDAPSGWSLVLTQFGNGVRAPKHGDDHGGG